MSPLVTTPPARQLCIHCARRVRRTTGGGSRGLCYTCYYTPKIRRQYPADPKRGKRCQERPAAGRPLPDRPTDAEPGSAEKARVMMERIRRGQQLHHPFDRKAGDDKEDG